MTVDIEKLEALAKAATGFSDVSLAPDVLLELIANAVQWEKACHQVNRLFVDATEQACAARRERDQLKAEVAGLKTGYEAYERVNAELRAECEALRNNQSFSDAFYEVACLLGVTGARPEAPLVVFRQEVVPALQAVISNSRRYEWLRDQAQYDWDVSYGKLEIRIATPHHDASDLDACIDAAIDSEASQ